MTSTRKVNFAYNDDDVLTTRTLTTKTHVAESFVYDDNGLVSSHTVTHGEDVDAYSYTYDDDGNITEIKKGGATQQSYVYDANNQLIRENNIDTGKTIVYTYDGYGNILSKNEYAYTLGDLGAVVDTVNYSYDTAWKDKLVSYDGQSITYDEIGNPTNYMGAQMTWFARQMQSYTKGNTSITYKYDSDGLRTQKVINGVKHEYYYVDGKLQFEKKGDEYQIYYRYDSNGRPALAIKHDIAQAKNYYYYLITNTRGDVIETRNGEGAVNAKFTYDAWGKLISVTDANGNALSQDSFAYQISLKYRGYAYDAETGLYYLQSRYYDPETGRFLNADSVDYIGYSGEVLSYNIFAYCENNAVNGWDDKGNSATLLLATTYATYKAFSIVLSLLVVSSVAQTLYYRGAFNPLISSLNMYVSEIGNVARTAIEKLNAEINKALTKAKTKARTTKTNRHHIIAQKAKRAAVARDIWKKYYKIDDNRNLIDINRNLHMFLHTNIYYDSVNAIIKGANSKRGKKGVIVAVILIRSLLQTCSNALL